VSRAAALVFALAFAILVTIPRSSAAEQAPTDSGFAPCEAEHASLPPMRSSTGRAWWRRGARCS
jgi:hypothetical protein